MLPSGRGAGRALGAPAAHRYLPPTFHQNAPPLGELVVLPSPSLYETLCQGSPPSLPTPLSSLPAPQGLFWAGGRVLCCPCLKDLALAEAARKGWNLLVLPGGGRSKRQPPLWGTSEMAMLNTPPDRPSLSPVPPPWLPGLETFFGNRSPGLPTLPWG